MAIDKVKDYFRQFSMEDRIMEFDVSSATVELAAKALGCEPCRIAKSITLDFNGTPLMVVTAGDMKIDNKKYKETFRIKAKMLGFEDVERLVGHAVGGVCPFAVNDKVRVYLDVSMKRFDTVFPACGSSNSAIELSMEELEKYSGYVNWVDVCKSSFC